MTYFIQVTYKPGNSGVRCAVLLNVKQITEIWDATDGKGGCHIERKFAADSPLRVAESFSEVVQLIKEASK